MVRRLVGLLHLGEPDVGNGESSAAIGVPIHRSPAYAFDLFERCLTYRRCRRFRESVTGGGAAAARPSKDQTAPLCTCVRLWMSRGRIMVLSTHNTDIADGWEREGVDPRYFYEFSVNSSPSASTFFCTR